MKLTYSDLLTELGSGARVALMIRHAERPHIDRTDPTFGETLAGLGDLYAASDRLEEWIDRHHTRRLRKLH